MTLAGKWQNEFGSTMDLTVEDGIVQGVYTSSTGSSGEYRVIGFQQNGEPSSNGGQACALAINWHSIVPGKPDNSWHWVSGLSGQLSIQDGGEQLVVAHALVASVEFPDFAAAGTYIDKLIYKRISDESSHEPAEIDKSAAIDDPLVGNWYGADGTNLNIEQVIPFWNDAYKDGAFGIIFGLITWNGVASQMYGVTDIHTGAPFNLDRKSVSIVALPDADNGPAVSLAGTLDLRNKILNVLNLPSQATAPANSYLQTTVSTKTFTQ